MRQFSLWAVVGVFFLACQARAAEKPNFLVFIADDMAWDDCGAYGHPHIRTPNIDALAREGMRFDRAFLTCSSCSPSRSSILTGRYPHNTGAEQLHWPLPADQFTIFEALRKGGYWTASAGKWHLGNAAKAKVDSVNEGGQGNPWLETVRNRPKDKPFFIWAAFFDPHRGYQKNTIPQPHTADDAVVPPFLPDTPAVRNDLAMYYDEIARLDGVVGMVMKELAEQGVADNTVVVFMTDNGRPFPRCKTTVYDSGIKTPFIVRWPGKIKPGSVCERLVSSVDLAPTLVALAGLPAEKSFMGVDFSPLFSDPEKPVREHVFAEHNWHDYQAHQRAVRNERYKYIRNEYPELPLTPPADAVRSPTFVEMQKLRDAGKLTRVQMECFVKPRPIEEFYDLQNDPYELKNLVGFLEHAGELARLRHRLDDWQKQTRDGLPRVVTPDGFDRETGEQLPQAGPRRRQPGQESAPGDEE